MPTPAEITTHFAAIARRYELANTLLSFGIERLWRKRLIREARVQPGQCILDVCTGTAGIVRDLRIAQPSTTFVGVDLTRSMLCEGQRTLRAMGMTAGIVLVGGDGCRLPVGDGRFDLVTIGYGLRNLPDPGLGVAEMVRALRRGGRLVILEFAPLQPGVWGMIYRAYRRYCIPLLGGMITGAPAAYRHLSRSIGGFLKPGEVLGLMERNGLGSLQAIPLSGGIAYIYAGEKT